MAISDNPYVAGKLDAIEYRETVIKNKTINEILN